MDVWPLRPNWREPVRLTHAFKTEVISSRNRKEQRRSLWQAPRKSAEFVVTTHRDRFRSLTRVLASRQGPLVAWADVTRSELLTATPSAGTHVITLQNASEWLVAGFKTVLVLGDRMELMTVQSASGATVTFVELLTSWPAKPVLCPAIVGRVPAEVNTQQFLPGVVEATVRVDQDPGSELPRFIGEPDVLWNGREVFTKRGNWADPRDFNFSRDIDMVDYGQGRTQAFLPAAFGTTIRAIDYHAKNRTEADDLLRFFERCRGQLREFYVPSDQPDILLASSASGGTTQFTALGSDLLAAYATDPVYKAISIRMKDGTYGYAHIDSLSANGGNTRFNLTSGLPFAIDPDDVEVISWMPVTRFASDEVTFEWLTDGVAQVRFTLQSLPDAPAE